MPSCATHFVIGPGFFFPAVVKEIVTFNALFLASVELAQISVDGLQLQKTLKKAYKSTIMASWISLGIHPV